MNFDLGTLTLVGLVALGTVNVITFFKPDMDSREKFAISAVVAFAAAFIPPDLGNLVLNNAKTALAAALLASGVYKVATKAGGN